jgi:hypothetical protein
MSAQLAQEARAAASIVSLLLAKPDLNGDELLQLVQANRRLNRLLDQLIPSQDDLLPQANVFSIVSSQRLPSAGHVPAGRVTYCRGCGFSFDSTNPIAAAPHRTH